MSFIQFRHSFYQLRDRVPHWPRSPCQWLSVIDPCSCLRVAECRCLGSVRVVDTLLSRRVFSIASLHDWGGAIAPHTSSLKLCIQSQLSSVHTPHQPSRHICMQNCHFKYLSISKLLKKILDKTEGSTEIIFRSKISWHHARLLLLIVPSVCCVDVYWIGIYSLNIGHEESFIYIYSVTPGWGWRAGGDPVAGCCHFHSSEPWRWRAVAYYHQSHSIWRL